MKKIVDVSGYGCKVKLDFGRLAIEGRDGVSSTLPIADIAVVVLSDAAVSVSGAVLAELATVGATVVVSDRAHLPVGLYQPIASNLRQTAVLLGQTQARTLTKEMWVFALFDLPSLTAFQRKKYHAFRKSLLKHGFSMLQKSVYMRWVDTDAIADALRGSVMRNAPEEGMVTVFSLTERALAAFNMRVDGEWRRPPSKPANFLIF